MARAAKTNKKLSLAIAAIIVVVAVAAFIVMQVVGGADAGADAYAKVVDGDGNTYELPLSQDGETTVTSSLGTNVVEVQDGRVRVREADCPNQDCVEQEWISRSGQQIVCLPHKLTVDVVGAESAGYDVLGS